MHDYRSLYVAVRICAPWLTHTQTQWRNKVRSARRQVVSTVRYFVLYFVPNLFVYPGVSYPRRL